MGVVDIPTFKVIASPAIGARTDGGGFDSGLGLAFSANGGDGTLSIVAGEWQVRDGGHGHDRTGRRTMAVDGAASRLPVGGGILGSGSRRQKDAPVLPDSFTFCGW